MIVGLFCDVHGNLPALETFIKLTRGVADSYVCLGDIVNYGPWNDECLELIFSLPNITVLEGNHERLFLEPHRIHEELPIVQEFTERSIEHFTRRDLITALPESYRLGKYLCSHTIGDIRVFPDSDIQITQNCIVGHSHHQFAKPVSQWTIVNCGSVGQNRKNIELINYALYDSASEEIRLCQATYPFSVLIDEMTARGYSRRCQDYYLNKRGAV